MSGHFLMIRSMVVTILAERMNLSPLMDWSLVVRLMCDWVVLWMALVVALNFPVVVVLTFKVLVKTLMLVISMVGVVFS